MRVLVICDDFYHPGDIVIQGLEPLNGQDFQFEFMEDAKEWSDESLKNYPVIILSKSDNVSSKDRSNWVTPEVENAFTEYVKQGGGLLAIHSGTAEYMEKKQLKSLLGGVFEHHPEQCPVKVEPTQDHPITKNAEAFTVKDEHYFMDMCDSEKEFFMSTTSVHGIQPGGWTRTEGKGRVCVITPGHNLEVWLNPSFQTIIKNSIKWCACEI
jgi:type 1 glutamine amidotransferase